ncbi:hypothetical protein ACFW9F_24615, partial [Streptomyces sp. NPDC059506]
PAPRGENTPARGPPRYPVEELRTALDLPDYVPLVECDARDRSSSRDVLMALMRYLHSLTVTPEPQ